MYLSQTLSPWVVDIIDTQIRYNKSLLHPEHKDTLEKYTFDKAKTARDIHYPVQTNLYITWKIHIFSTSIVVKSD